MRRFTRRAAGLFLAAAVTLAAPAFVAAAAETTPSEIAAQDAEECAGNGSTAGADEGTGERISYEKADPVEPGTQETEASDNCENSCQSSTTGHEAAISAEPVEIQESGREAKASEESSSEGKTEEKPGIEEPDWLCGGNGGKTDISSSQSIRFTEVHWIRYKGIGLGDWMTCTYEAERNGEQMLTEMLCVDPEMFGYGLKDMNSSAVYEYSTPMLIKSVYYGTGPGRDTLRRIVRETRGSEDLDNVCEVITHVTASQVYAVLHNADPSMGSVKSAPGAGFNNTEPIVKELVYKYANELENLPLPDNYYVYVVTVSDDTKQDFAFGSYSLEEKPGYLALKKSASDPDTVYSNRCYSLEGAEYGVYTDAECTQEAGVLVTDGNGDTEAIEIEADTVYYVKEKKAPEGYFADDKVYEAGPAKAGESCTVEVKDVPGVCDTKIRILKKSRTEGENAPSLAGTEFTVSYYDGYYSGQDLPEEAARTWVIRSADGSEGCLAELSEKNLVSGELFVKDDAAFIPLGTITIRETKAAPGYINDGEFGNGSGLYIGRIEMNDSGNGVELVHVQGKPEYEDEYSVRFTVRDTPEQKEEKENEKEKEKNPKLKTCAVNKETGDHTAKAGGFVTIDDTVTYSDFDGGQEYGMSGRLIDRSTGETMRDKEGREITASVRFTADASGSGTVVIPFTFETDQSFGGKKLVAFERAVKVETGEVTAVHEDLNDEEQSVFFVEQEHPKKTVSSNNTGDSSAPGPLLASVLVCAACIAGAVKLRKKR